jgi:hypothetical protein
MPLPQDDWTCLDCTAINPRETFHCWKCKAPYHLAPEPPSAAEVRQSHFTGGDEPLSFRDLFLQYAGASIQINCVEPDKQKSTYLIGVHSEYFSVLDIRGRQEVRMHFPYSAILSCWEDGDMLFIEVHRQVFPKGGLAFGMSIPL